MDESVEWVDCTECSGSGAHYVIETSIGSDGKVQSCRVGKTCGGCNGKGRRRW